MVVPFFFFDLSESVWSESQLTASPFPVPETNPGTHCFRRVTGSPMDWFQTINLCKKKKKRETSALATLPLRCLFISVFRNISAVLIDSLENLSFFLKIFASGIVKSCAACLYHRSLKISWLCLIFINC